MCELPFRLWHPVPQIMAKMWRWSSCTLESWNSGLIQQILGNSYSSVCDADCGPVPQIMVKSWKCAAGMSSALPGIFGALDDSQL